MYISLHACVTKQKYKKNQKKSRCVCTSSRATVSIDSSASRERYGCLCWSYRAVDVLFTSFNWKWLFVSPFPKKIRVQDVRKLKGNDILHFFCPLYDDDDVTQSNATFIKEIIEKKRNKKSSKTQRRAIFVLFLRALSNESSFDDIERDSDVGKFWVFPHSGGREKTTSEVFFIVIFRGVSERATGEERYVRLTQRFPFSFGLLGLLLLDPAFVSFVFVMRYNQQQSMNLKRLFVSFCCNILWSRV